MSEKACEACGRMCDMKDLNLDVSSPEDALGVLYRAVQEYLASASELESAWQDRSAGSPWVMIARELYRAAARIEKRLK